jgi:hypothetical protein
MNGEKFMDVSQLWIDGWSRSPDEVEIARNGEIRSMKLAIYSAVANRWKRVN